MRKSAARGRLACGRQCWHRRRADEGLPGLRPQELSQPHRMVRHRSGLEPARRYGDYRVCPWSVVRGPLQNGLVMRTKHSQEELKRLVETAVTDVCGPPRPGLWFCVEHVKLSGRPLEIGRAHV